MFSFRSYLLTDIHDHSVQVAVCSCCRNEEGQCMLKVITTNIPVILVVFHQTRTQINYELSNSLANSMDLESFLESC
jgi:hypothetical protein